MKKAVLVIFLLSMFILICVPKYIKADSGFDSSWDSGSSSSSSSGWSGGSDWGGSSDSSSGGDFGWVEAITFGSIIVIFSIGMFNKLLKQLTKKLFLSDLFTIIFAIFAMFINYLLIIKFEFFFFLLIEFIILFVFIIISYNMDNNINHSIINFGNIKKYTNSTYKEKVVIYKNGKLQKVITNGFTDDGKYDEFKKEAFNIYKDLQIAWMNFDYDKIRSLVSDEMYNMYSMQLDTLKVKGQKNIMDDIIYVNSYICSNNVENEIETIKMNMIVECYDYLVDDKNNVIRGNKNVKMHYEYELTFTRNISGTTIDKCPNCGADININSGGVCEYCNSTIVNKESNWILVKKEMINQRRR